jgi:magnesium chelatase subunit D
MAERGEEIEATAVEDFRNLLPREYGYEIVKQQYALYIRVPFSEVTVVTPEGLAHLERALRRWEFEIKSGTETCFLIADKDFVEIPTDRFLILLRDREIGPIREAVQDLLRRIETGRDTRLRRILNDLSSQRERHLLDSVRHGGRAAKRLVVGRRGRVAGYRSASPAGVQDLAVVPTIRMAIRKGAKIGDGKRLDIKKEDLQENIRYARIGSYIGLIVDTSTYDEEIREQTEGLVKSLLLDAYERRDRVALVLMQGDSAEIASDFTSDLEAVRIRFMETRWGGLSPFSSGIMQGTRLFLARLADTIDAVRIFLVISTGRANVPMVQGGNVRRELAALPMVLLSTELEPVVVDVSHHGSTFLREFANQTKGRYYHPATVRYYKITLAHELLSSMEEGSKEKTVGVGKAFLEKLSKAPTE